MLNSLLKNKEYLRSVLFGIEDSLISTTGFLAGVTVGTSDKHIIIISTLIAITIEGVSMGVGEYLSDDAVKDLDKLKRSADKPLFSGAFLCISYLLAGMIPFVPVLFFSSPLSLIISLIAALLALFLLGYLKGELLHTSAMRGGIKILLVGGITTLLGMVVGFVLK